MLEAIRKYLLEEGQVIVSSPAIFTMAILVVGAAIWGVIRWSYHSILSHREAEIKLLERRVVDLGRQVDDMQKQPGSHSAQEFAKTAALQLRFHGDERSPTRLTHNNIWRWYYLRLAVIHVEIGTGSEHRSEIGNLFVTFDQPVEVGTLEISSPDMALPANEVKEFTNRYAIIVFSQLPSAGTVEIRVQ